MTNLPLCGGKNAIMTCIEGCLGLSELYLAIWGKESFQLSR